MPTRLAAKIGSDTLSVLSAFGEFWRFVGSTFFWLGRGSLRWKNMRLVFPQMYEVGVQSVPVVGITGAFIGMVMAIETYTQFKRHRPGEPPRQRHQPVSVVKQIGPVLAAVMLAGRVGGALTAELGTMNVTEQLDALRVMGADPIRVPGRPALPRLHHAHADPHDLQRLARRHRRVARSRSSSSASPTSRTGGTRPRAWTTGRSWKALVKSVFFGGAIGLISCYKGFTCGSGASGVGRACTESFVTSFIAIIVLNFFFAKVAKDWYIAIYGMRGCSDDVKCDNA